MEKRKLEIHTFYLHENRKPSQIIDYSDVYGRDLFDVFKTDFLPFVDGLAPSQVNGKTTKIEVNNESKKSLFKTKSSLRYVSGKIKIGEDQNKEQDVVTADKNKDRLFTIEKGQSVERPFFFFISLPEKSNKGFIVLEREGRHAMKGDFSKIFRKFINDKFSELDVKINGFVESELIKEFLINGDYERIILSRKYLPADKSERYLGTYHDGGAYQIQLNIIPQAKTVIPILTKKKIVRHLEHYDGFFEDEDLKNLGFDENANIKVVTTYNGNKRTIDLEDTLKTRPYYLIDVKIDAKGFSDYKSINKETITLLKSFNLGII
ncbi:hypothetical protein H2O64_21760 [Kordia sp. YSTF-M3]|uniref:DUF4747 family protein n=1 Tax=Kordia aestuariivivens TaxID=2759037 RepID=A0ABR7QG11_9FLAO|nr:hypothetical protein [Kordia aestuariivivens]MBC8757311.1 hypothetical protein [Kordia aestuariivivens]